MALGLAEIILLGLLADYLMRKLRLPGLIGLLLLGVLFGPYALAVINPETAAVAADWRMIALVVILLRAGLEMSKKALAKVGGRAVLMGFVPCLFEAAFVTLAGPRLLSITTLEAAMLGSILAAVSPAVVVPLMIRFIEEKRGAKSAAPTLVLAGSSCDDAVAIVLCGALISAYTGSGVNVAAQLAHVPVSVLTGIIAGLALGLVLCRFFERFDPRATKRVLIMLGLSVVIIHLQALVERYVPFSALLAIMAAGFIILEKRERFAHEISAKLGKVWVFAQLLLFVFVGTQVNVPVAVKAGAGGIALIFFGLLGRSLAVQLCLIRSSFNAKERLFITLSYLPKATVQAAIGASPLIAMKAAGMHETPGEIILAVAAMSILLTAPLGSLAISIGGKHLLDAPD